MHLPLPRELGNRFALVLLSLPSGPGALVLRLAETKRRMDHIKVSPEPAITFSLIQAIGLLGTRLNRSLVAFFAGKVTGVTTNVPGPRFTYAGTVRIGFKTDAAVIGDPEQILTAFHAEIEALERAVDAAAPARSAHSFG
ncbi:MAG: WS/DGAT domain-containing protein [Nocardioides sp.]